MNRLIILLFHDVYRHSVRESGFTGAGADRYKLSVENFRAQISSVHAMRKDSPKLVNSLSVDGRRLLPFAISVDDGGLSYHAIVAPHLEQLGWFGHCLITTGQIGQPGFLHKHHIRELHAAGHLIGTHTVTHPAAFGDCRWDKQVMEWSRSRLELEDIIGDKVSVGSVPGGAYTRNAALSAREAGLDILMTSEPVTWAHEVNGCRVFGRFTVRRNSPPDLAGKLVGLERSRRNRQWVAWNTKKQMKKVLGRSYSGICNWIAR